MLDIFLTGLWQIAASPQSLLILGAGLVGGLLFGAIPGLSGLTLATLALPLSAHLAAPDAMILFGAIYVAGVYGGAVTAILFNIPGDANSAPTAIDGYHMTRQGRGAEAIGAAIVASTIGGVLSAVLLVAASEPIAMFAVRAFGPPEILAFVVLGLALSASVGGDVFRGMAAVSLGLLVASIGFDPTGTASRFSFGNVQLSAGIGFAPLILGFFGIAEVAVRIAGGGAPRVEQRHAKVRLTGPRTLWRLRGDVSRSSAIGLAAGLLPGVGATLASFLAYAEGKRWSRERDRFGKGALGGVICSETANNAATGASLIPLLALGLPGGAFSAIMLASLNMHGIQPGPMVFLTQPALVGAVFATMFVSSALILVLGFLEASLILRLLRLHFGYIAVGIVVLSVIGAYSLRNSLLDVAVMFLAGAAGFALRRGGFPIPALVLGVVLGGIAEAQFVRTVQLLDGDAAGLLTRPIAATLLALAILSILLGIVRTLRRPLIAA